MWALGPVLALACENHARAMAAAKAMTMATILVLLSFKTNLPLRHRAEEILDGVRTTAALPSSIKRTYADIYLVATSPPILGVSEKNENPWWWILIRGTTRRLCRTRRSGRGPRGRC